MGEDEHPSETNAKAPWFDAVCAILMAVASLLTAWCSYQTSAWGGRAANYQKQAEKLERQAVAMHLEAQQIETMQVRAVMEVIDARISGNEKLANFYVDRFGEELKPAYEKWIALNPFEDPSAPPHPFVPSLYAPHFGQDIRDAHAEAGRLAALGTDTGHTASKYLSNTVLLATVLFFAGTAGKFDHRRVRRPFLAFAVGLFLYTAGRMLTLPMA